MKKFIFGAIASVAGFFITGFSIVMLGFTLTPDYMVKYHTAPSWVTLISLAIGIALGRLIYKGLNKI